MKNRVYYGEYSLKHWIELLLKKNIILPEYQRLFVWNEEGAKGLIQAFRDKQFIPPVTIGALNNNDDNQNIILDGQQRLTSILLAYIGLFPDKNTYKAKLLENIADDNDNIVDDDEPLDDILDWRFDQLTQKGNNKQEITSKIISGNYKAFDVGIDDEFLKNTFLGFSYLVPEATDFKQQQKYYSTVFRNINYRGEKLSTQESRKSLYFLDNTLAQFFDPDFCKDIKIKNSNIDAKIDFVRYLALLSQYKKNIGVGRVARGYKSDMEKYYEGYIYSITGDVSTQMFSDFSTDFPNRDYNPRLQLLEQLINELEIPKSFTSIIDSDMFLFGIIYLVVFLGKQIDIDRKGELVNELSAQIRLYKNDYSHSRAPGALKYLRERIENSITIYGRYEK